MANPALETRHSLTESEETDQTPEERKNRDGILKGGVSGSMCVCPCEKQRWVCVCVLERESALKHTRVRSHRQNRICSAAGREAEGLLLF